MTNNDHPLHQEQDKPFHLSSLFRLVFPSASDLSSSERRRPHSSDNRNNTMPTVNNNWWNRYRHHHRLSSATSVCGLRDALPYGPAFGRHRPGLGAESISEVELVFYADSFWRRMLYLLLCLLTVGVLPLVCRWHIDYFVRVARRRVPGHAREAVAAGAERVLVRDLEALQYAECKLVRFPCTPSGGILYHYECLIIFIAMHVINSHDLIRQTFGHF
jgi:hypothetical protein